VKYAVITFGCRVNQADSLGLEEALRLRGAENAPVAAADLIVVNTCSVTATADQGARQTIRRLAREHPSAKIVVTGCYATREPADVSALPGVLRVVPNDDKERLVEALADAVGLTTARRFGEGDGPCGAAVEPGVAGRTAYTVRVQTGCEEACTYCIIPSTRGRSRSVPPDAVLADVVRAAKAGFKEVAVTGVHLGSYGRDLSPALRLIDLLRALAGCAGDVQFRVSSLEPMDCPPEVVDLVAQSGRFAPHFHLPLQHASDRMLRQMDRPYTLDAYRRLVDGIRERLPSAAIGTDVIAGFPGETDEDSAATEAYLPASPLTHVHVFPYSDRPGTVASGLPGRPHGSVVRGRAQRLREMSSALARRFRDAQLGTVRPGLTLEDGTLVVTDNYLKVRIPPGLTRNMRVDVRIEEVGADVRGRVVACR
jgi:threonylcarbamoyladenosine tRNA methylthiotransferase MtaB